MQATLRKFCAAAAFLFAVAGNAAPTNIDPRVAKFDTCGRYELFSINGIMTNSVDATNNLIRLQDVYGNSYKEHLIAYRLAYNQTRGMPTDFADSAKQVMSLYAGVTWDIWLKAVTFGIYDPSLSPAVAEAIAKKVDDMYGLTRPSSYQTEDLNDIVNAITTQTASGKKLLVGHSQGTIYLSMVYDRMVQKGFAPNTIGAVGIAVAYSSIPTGNVYVTSANDLIVDSVRLATLPLTLAGAPPVLPPTIKIPYRPTIDVFGHNMQQTYLNALNTGSIGQITTAITREFGSIKSPYPGTHFPDYPVTYASTPWKSGCGGAYDAVGNFIPGPECFIYWTVAPYNESQYVIVQPGSVSSAKTAVRANAKACYALAVEGIKNAQATRPPGTSWVWFTMGYPNNYGCWDMVSGNPATDYRPGAWWLYGGDKPPVWRITGPLDVYTGLVSKTSGVVYAEGGAVCN